MSDPDLVVIGGGAAGVAAALHGRRLGADVVLIERGLLGGTCVHAGCVPSGAYHTSAGLLRAVRAAAGVGVDVGPARLDWGRMQAFVSRTSQAMAAAVRRRLDYAGVRVEARDATPGPVADHPKAPVVVATGAVATPPEGTLSAEAVMGLTRRPEVVHVLGGERFSLEWADFFAAAGSAVTVVAEELLPGEDRELVAFLREALEERGVRIVARRPAEPASVVLAVDAREPSVPGMGVDTQCRTAVAGVWAAGDVTGPRWLANRAAAQGVVAAANALGGSARLREERLPRSVNTEPELAAVGLTEAQAAQRGITVMVGVADLGGNARAVTTGQAPGALKLVVDPEYGEILGGHMIGMGAREVVSQVALAMTLEADYRDLLQAAPVHPSLAELVTEALADCQAQS